MRTRKMPWLSVLLGGVLVAAMSIAARADDAARDDKGPIAKGEYLARAGDCIACHTNPGGALFAGGFAMPTPFGTLYSSNITPDRETGIGTWSADDFYGAMHTGRFPDGGLMYPAMPFGSVHEGHARGFRRDLRLSPFRAAGAPAEQAAGPAVSLQQPVTDPRLAYPVLPGRRVQAGCGEIG